MEKKTLQFEIVTPERVVYQNEAREIVVPTGVGYLTILPKHIPLVGTVTTGEIRVTLLDGTVHPFAVSSGILEVQPRGKVVVLADRSELAHDIDITRAEEAYRRAEEVMKQIQDSADVDYARFEALIAKELNRINVAKKWK